MSSDQRFFDFLKERIGLDVTSVGPAIIERAVRQRSTASKALTADEYWHTLQGSQDEQQALIEAVIVPETWFFRYPESFATLAKLAAKRLSDINNMRALRILSLPCSTGEEPYSIAMALLDAGLTAAPVQGRRHGRQPAVGGKSPARAVRQEFVSWSGHRLSRPAFHRRRRGLSPQRASARTSAFAGRQSAGSDVAGQRAAL